MMFHKTGFLIIFILALCLVLHVKSAQQLPGKTRINGSNNFLFHIIILIISTFFFFFLFCIKKSDAVIVLNIQ